MSVVINRLILQLAFGAAFGAGQLAFAIAASHASFLTGSAPVPSNAPVTTTTAPAGIGLG